MKTIYNFNILCWATFILMVMTPLISSAQDTLSVFSANHIQYLADVQIQKLDYELSLNDEQRQEIHKILIKRIEQFKSDQDSKRLNNSRFRTVNGSMLKQIKTILTKEQWDRYVALREELSRQKKRSGAPEESFEDKVLNLE